MNYIKLLIANTNLQKQCFSIGLANLVIEMRSRKTQGKRSSSIAPTGRLY